MTDREKIEAKRSCLINSLESLQDINEISKITYAIQEMNLILQSLPK